MHLISLHQPLTDGIASVTKSGKPTKYKMDPLDPSAVLETLPKLLPSDVQDAKLLSQSDALAALSHTILTRLDFRLINLGDSHQVAPHLDADDMPGAVTVQNRLPREWRRSAPESYSFGYRHEQSSLQFIVKVIKMGNRILINATALEVSPWSDSSQGDRQILTTFRQKDNKTASYEVEANNFTSASFFPYPSSQSTSQEPLVNGFISTSRIRDFLIAYKQQIVQKLLPGLRKDGYEDVEAGNSGSGSTHPSSGPQRQGQEQQQPRPFPGDPVGPRAPNRPPYFEDPDDPSLPGTLGRNPFGIGDRDLNPFGDPLAMPGRGPPPLFGGGPDQGGGMIVGPDHPMFRDRFQPGGIGDLDGRRNLPPGAVPPGARFDPIGPMGGAPRPPFGGPGRGRGRGGGGIGGDPDFDDFPPPRSVSQYPK